MNADMVGMPSKDFTVEFWAKTPAYNKDAPGHNPIADLFTYATHIPEAESICELLSLPQCSQGRQFHGSQSLIDAVEPR